MTRKSSTPAYCKQTRPDGQDRAFVELNGVRHYLGIFDSPESREKYHRLIGEWIAAGRELPVEPDKLTVVELAARYLRFAKRYYRQPDGERTMELYHVRKVLRLLRDNYGTTRAAVFGPRALKAIRERMIGDSLRRSTINQDVGRIKRIFKWGVAEELVPPSTLQALLAVPGLRRNRSEAREPEAVRPVPEAHVEAVRPHVSRQVWALVQLQVLTAARSGELVIMRPVDIDRSGPVWTFSPADHKTAFRGHKRTIFLGPRAQDVVRPFLEGRPPGAFLFSPAEAEEERRAALHARRKTPISCGNVPGSNRSRSPRRPPRERYDVNSYGRAIARACEVAKAPHWFPHQLRHLAATALRKQFGIDLARVILGHRSPSVTDLYAELDRSKALDVMERIG